MEQYAKNPAKFTIEWAGASDKGYFKRYDKETNENVEIKTIDFIILEQAHSASGYSKQFGTCFSNESQDHKEEKHIQVFTQQGDKRLPEVVLSGTWKDIKYEAKGKYGADFTAVVYAVLVDSSDKEMEPGSIVRVLLKRSSLGPWIDLKAKDGNNIHFDSFQEKEIGEAGVVGNIKYRIPVYIKSVVDTKYDKAAMRTEVLAFLQKKKFELMISMGQKDELPNSSPVENETAEVEDDVVF